MEDAATEPAVVSVLRDQVPADLGADRFFEILISTALDGMPVAVYPTVPDRRARARRETGT